MFRSLLTSSKVLSVNYIAKRNAGHSKWANIRHTKAEKDGQKSLLYTKLTQRIKVAIKDGGSANPASNYLLAQAIEVAKKACMPISTIDGCIKSAQNDKSKAESCWFEIRGPKGSLVIALALTEQHKRLKDNISSILRKTNTSFSSHAMKKEFEHKGIIRAKPPDGIENLEEAVVDHAIECGAEEVNPCEIEDGVYEFSCEDEQLQQVRGKLQNLKYSIESAEFEFIPKLKVELSDEQLEVVRKLVDKLEELPEVVKIYDNIA